MSIPRRKRTLSLSNVLLKMCLMIRKLARWCWIHKKLTVATLFVLAVVAVNAVAYMHAYAMTHFTRGGDRTRIPRT